jgi:thioredoxin 1
VKKNIRVSLLVKTAALIGLAGMVGYVESAGTSIGGNQSAPETNTSEAQNKKADYLVTFVELGSVKCIPCKMMQPVLREIEKDYGSQVKVVFYDVWTKVGRPYAQQYQIRAIPTQVFLDKDGKEYYRHTGFFSKAEIVGVLQKQGLK